MTNFISKYSWSSISGTCTFKIVTFIFLKSWGKIFNKISNLTWYKKLTDIKRDEHTPSHYPCWRLHVKKVSPFTSVKGQSHVNHKIRGVTPSLFSRQSYSLYLMSICPTFFYLEQKHNCSILNDFLQIRHDPSEMRIDQQWKLLL